MTTKYIQKIKEGSKYYFCARTNLLNKKIDLMSYKV